MDRHSRWEGDKRDEMKTLELSALISRRWCLTNTQCLGKWVCQWESSRRVWDNDQLLDVNGKRICLGIGQQSTRANRKHLWIEFSPIDQWVDWRRGRAVRNWIDQVNSFETQQNISRPSMFMKALSLILDWSNIVDQGRSFLPSSYSLLSQTG